MYEHERWDLPGGDYFFLTREHRANALEIVAQVSAWATERWGESSTFSWVIMSDYEVRIANPDIAFEFKMKWC